MPSVRAPGGVYLDEIYREKGDVEMTVDLETSLGELVRKRPASAKVLARFDLDYCCGGRRSLREACDERGLDAATVAVFLAHDPEPVALEPTDWAAAPVPALCAHIVDEHHARMRWELPRMSDLAERAASAHGDVRPELHEVRDELARLREELMEHMDDEERTLFPGLVAGGTVPADELEELIGEHDSAGARLRRLRELAGGYDLEAALCNTHRALLEGLHGLELDLHQHVHEENNILFPRVAA
jgi:regulator of cell morphogenesis and NO signaling